MPNFKILAINPGSTSTKIAVYEGEEQVFITTIRHQTAELEQYKRVADQFPFRKELILGELEKAGIATNDFNAIIGRGGLLRPLESGVYEVNDAMLADLRAAARGQHASNLGALIAQSIAASIPGAKAYIADPVVVDEMAAEARVTGLPEMHRISMFHALNHKAIGRAHAKKLGKKYEDLNLIIAHLGGGISVGAHQKGRVVDVNDALAGDGPFSPERAGELPTGQLVDLCFSGKYTREEVRSKLAGKGGLVALMGYNDAQRLENEAKGGSKEAALVQDAMCYNIAKWVGSMGAVLKGKVDGILITGGIAYNPYVVSYIREMTEHIAPVTAYPGEDEMGALAMNARMVLEGTVQPKVY